MTLVTTAVIGVAVPSSADDGYATQTPGLQGRRQGLTGELVPHVVHPSYEFTLVLP